MGSSLSKTARDRFYTCRKSGGTELNLSTCEMVVLHKRIIKFPHLRKLNLTDNRITLIPPQIRILSELEELILRSNELANIAPEIQTLSRLRLLDLSNNALSALPSQLPGTLEVLDISHNHIATIASVEGLGALTELHYNSNGVTIFPNQILSLHALRVLSLNGNRLNYVPDEITNMATLQVVNLADNQFLGIPPPLCHLPNLRVLNMGNNNIGTLTHEITRLTHLEGLLLPNTRIDRIDVNLGALTSLVELNLQGNRIVEFSPEICGGLSNLKRMRNLDLSQNLLKVVPKQIGHMRDLQKLGLAGNGIRTIPGDFYFINPAADISLVNNPLEPQYAQWVNDSILHDKLRDKITAYPPHCRLVDDPGHAPANAPVALNMQAYDYLDNPCTTSADPFTATLVSKEDPEVKFDVIMRSNAKDRPGTYTAYYNCPRPGSYTLAVMCEGLHVQGSPFNVEVAGP
eukprot:TRINITY_DN2079_c0_g1_i1.p1 TRINITY_DN2079_c0_g1~~TRINITY_DN2079_c0_g1_i1.p1  ORF type:complete len:486 (+),score=120.80 TRINITY_DN2079_c0_g1_i1:79-1458(+)